MMTREQTYALAALIATGAVTTIGFATGGALGPTVIGPSVIGAIGVNLASSIIQSGSLHFKEKWLSSPDGVLNHDIQHALARALNKALVELEKEYFQSAGGAALPAHEKAAVRALFKDLKEHDFLAPLQRVAQVPEENARIKALLLAPPEESTEQFWSFIDGQGLLQTYGFRDFLRDNLFTSVQFWFGEELKTDSRECNKAWRAYQRLLLEAMRAEVVAMHAGQQQIHEELKKLDAIQGQLEGLRDALDQRTPNEPFQQPFNDAVAKIGYDLKTLLATATRTESKVDIILERVAGPASPDRLWNVPHQSICFTGREQVLKDLQAELQRKGRAALSGLGGIGKTQTAIEYARLNRNHYRYVFWTRADTPAALATGFNEIARLLNLPEMNAREQQETTGAVRRWLQNHEDWLLIADNADDLRLAHEHLPLGGPGHVLITTRATATGALSEAVKLPKMTAEEGARLLLRRARRLDNDAPLETAAPADRDSAISISNEVAGLPLALDQAGAYIEETGCSPAQYLELYRAEGKALRNMRGDLGEQDHASVTVTFSLAFETVARANPAAADLLRLCAFFAPDAIPEELVWRSDSDDSNSLIPTYGKPEWDNILREAARFSLLTRDAGNRTLSVHRLVQDVLKDSMDEATQRHWAERAVVALNTTFPDVEFPNWPACDALLSHALICTRHIENMDMEFSNCCRLLNNAAVYLCYRARYSEAEPLYLRAFSIQEKVLGPEHQNTLSTLNNLASLYVDQGDFDKAEPLHHRALTTREQVLGPEHADTATSLNNLGYLYHAQRRFNEAEPLFQRALEIRRNCLGQVNPLTASSLNNLAVLYRNQGKLADAEPLYQEALTLTERLLGPEHPDTANSLNNLAGLYRAQGKLKDAEMTYLRAIEILDKVFGLDHPETAISVNNLAMILHDRGQFKEAEVKYKHALAVFESILGPIHPNTQTVRQNYTSCLREMKQSERYPFFFSVLRRIRIAILRYMSILMSRAK